MKWEYRVERINVGAVNRIEKIQEQLNTLGPEGWEAFATLSSVVRHTDRYLLSEA